MKKNNKLTLHEAIVVAIINLNKETFQATFEEIIAYIEKHKLYAQEKKGVPPTRKQICMRVFCSQQKYSFLFEKVGEDTVKLCVVSKKEKTAV
jgi:hypothetical protein